MDRARRAFSTALQAARTHPAAVDLVAAAALTVGGVAAVAGLHPDRHPAAALVAAIICTSSLAWRRSAPALAASVCLCAVAAYQIASHDSQGTFIVLAVIATTYLAGRQPIRLSLMVAVIGLAAICAIEADRGFTVGGVVSHWVPLVVLPSLVGHIVNRQAWLIVELRKRRAQLLGEVAIAQERATATERLRLARELHDVVAHCVSVTVIQAGAARMVADHDPQTAADSLAAVATSGRTALAELRRMSDVAPPEVANVGRTHSATSGLVPADAWADPSVHAELAADMVLPDEVGRTVARIIQESLTNARKHAAGATTHIEVSSTDSIVTVTVENSSPQQRSTFVFGDQRPSLSGSGQGLVGMRERVAIIGGGIAAGPTASGGFRVQATLPLPSTAAVKVNRRSVLRDRDRIRSRRPSDRVIDGASNLAWLVAMESEAITSSHRAGPMAMNIAVVAVMALSGLIRRRAPLLYAALVACGAVVLSPGLTSFRYATIAGTYVALTVPYTLSAYLRPRVAAPAMVVLLVGIAVTGTLNDQPPGAVTGAALLSCAVWLIGAIVARQRSLRSALEEVTRLLAAERDGRAQAGRDAERVRVASALNASVADLIESIVTKAETSRLHLVTQPADTTGALDDIAAIERIGREALNQLRDLLGILRNAVGRSSDSTSSSVHEAIMEPTR